MDSVIEGKENPPVSKFPLTPQQAEFVRLSRAHDQMYHSYIKGYLNQADEIGKRRYELGKKYGIRLISSDLIGFDEERNEFEEGHMTENDRRERGSRKPIARGKGAYCSFVDGNTGEHITVIDFDNAEDKTFSAEKADVVKEFMNRGGWDKHRNVILVQGKPAKTLS